MVIALELNQCCLIVISVIDNLCSNSSKRFWSESRSSCLNVFSPLNNFVFRETWEREVSTKSYTRTLKISPYLRGFLSSWDAACVLIIDLCYQQVSFIKTRLYFQMLRTDMFCWKLLGVNFNCLRCLVIFL